MAEVQKEGQAAEGAVQLDEFSMLLKKEFKPKTTQANEAVERAVKTLAEHALAQNPFGFAVPLAPVAIP